MKTEFTASHALRVEKWSALMFKYPRYKSFFSKYIGENTKAKGADIATSENAMIQLKSDFSKGKGDKVHFGMIAPLRNAGVTGDQQLEGNEEALTAYEWNVELKKVRNAVTNEGELSDKRVEFDAKMQAKEQLGQWLGHKIDNYSGCALAGVASNDGNVAANAPSNGNRKWVGGQTAAGVIYNATGNLDANFDATATNNLMGPEVIEAVKRKATMIEPVMRPIVINGKDYFIMFMHPLQAKALKASASWKSGHYYADIRGEKNPLFSGALGVWDGVILHEYQKCETRLGAGGSTVTEYFDSGDVLDSGVYAARALFCGAQAVVQAYGKLPYYKADSFDYGDEWGVAVGVMTGVSKPEFNSEDYGVMVIDTEIVAD